jgi:heavy metal sensor kinase
MTMFNSVRARLTLSYLLVFGSLLVGFSVLIYVLLSRSLYDRLDSSLSNAAQATASEFLTEIAEFKGDGKAGAADTLRELRVPNIYTAIFSRENLLASNYPEGQQVFLPPELVASARDSAIPAYSTVPGFGGDGGRMAVILVTTNGEDYFVTVVEPLRDLVGQLESVERILYMGLPATLLVAGIGGFLLARRSFAPVVEMSNQAKRISATNLQERLNVRNPRDELGRLAAVFNELLSRLDRSFENMREFTADASHELRTPLAVIRGEADVALSQEREAVEYRETLAIIQDEARRLSRLVDDMLALARADAAQQQLQLEDFYLNDLLEETCRTMQVLAMSKSIALTLDVTDDVTFHGDEDLLRRLIVNLLDNAIRYTPSGGAVSVKLASEANTLRIIVSDTGVGIPAESAPFVFDRFYRVHKARSRADGGSGLGLAIAMWVAEAHEGSIEVTSTPGHGSTFTVSLPR